MPPCVQGMFFRSFVKEKADELNVRGHVRNKTDGDVEAWFEGNNTDVDKLVEICKQGPEHSVIKKLEVKEEHFQGLKDFKVLKM